MASHGPLWLALSAVHRQLAGVGNTSAPPSRLQFAYYFVTTPLGFGYISTYHAPAYQALQAYAAQNVRHEMTVRSDFQNLLADATVPCRVPLSAATGVKPSVGQLASVIVRQYLQALQETPEAAACADVAGAEAGQEISRSFVERMIDERLEPLRERVRRLEGALQAVVEGKE